MCFFHPESTNLPDFGVPGARIIRWKSLKSPKIWKKLKSRLSGGSPKSRKTCYLLSGFFEKG